MLGLYKRRLYKDGFITEHVYRWNTPYARPEA